jgi:hypothetical protein
MKNTKNLIALVLLLLTVISQNAFALDCTIKNARVRYSNRNNDSKVTYFWVGNLNKSIMIPISEGEMGSELGKALKKSDGNKDFFINLTLAPAICNSVMTAEEYRSFMIFPQNLTSVVASQSSASDCVDCVNFKNAPIAISLPPMSDMKRILDKSAGFSSENVNLTAALIVHMFERMNNKTANANSLVFSVSLLKALEALKVKTINKDQLQYLAMRFKEQLAPDQFNLLQKIFKQLESLNFDRDSNGQLKVSLTTTNAKPIVLVANDIPVATPADREMVKKYFEKVEIADKTSLVFTDKKISEASKAKSAKLNEIEIKSFVTPSTVNIEGIKVFGQFPILGGVMVNPEVLTIDIDDVIPAKAKVSFKKGILGMSYTFDLNN